MAGSVRSTDAASLWRHVPNAISVLRILLVVPVALAIEARCFRVALLLAIIAGVSDGIDGWLARRCNWRSRLGSVLDPAADKLLLVTCFVLLSYIGEAPWALTALVLGRDFVIAVGALVWVRVLGDFTAKPSWVSKCCTLLQILYVLVLLVHEAGWWAWMPMAPWVWLVVVFTSASGLDYIVRWGHLARVELLAQRRAGRRDES